jgi:lipooligosaccharide transport system permease protein
VWKRNLVAYKRFILPTLLVSLGEPFFYLIALGLGLGAYMGLPGGVSYIKFLAPGLIIASCMMTSTFECLYDSFVRMIHEKIYYSLIVTPISAEDVVAGDIVWGVFRGVISGFLMFIIALLLGAVPLSLMVAVEFFLLMVAIGILFGSLAMIVTSFAPNFDFFNYYTQLVVSPIFFFSGAFFPLDHFPKLIQDIAQFSPLTHGVVVARAISSGAYSPALIINLLAIILPAVVVFYLAVFFMKRRLIK